MSADLGRRLLAEGHHRVNFAIVAAGANAASPHHEAGRPGHRARRGRAVRLRRHHARRPTAPGYCSDITRCVWTGEPPAEFAELYAVLREAQAAAVAAATVGTPCEDVDARRPRRIITDAGYGELLHPPHRSRHRHRGARGPLHRRGQRRRRSSPGHAFSIEPGIYMPGRWGARLEDIVVATDDGPDPLNRVEHDLVVVDA